MYEPQSATHVDEAANVLVKLATIRPHFVRFNETGAVCHHCGNHLGIYYCENGTFAVRCLNCQTLTLVKSRNPGGALQRVAARVDTKGDS